MIAEPVVAYIATNQIVYTYQPDQWPLGVLTGHRQRNTFVLRHVIVFPGAPPTTLMQMLYGGLDAAWEHGYASVVFHLQHDHPATRGLAAVAARLGFAAYAWDTDRTWYWLPRPA